MDGFGVLKALGAEQMPPVIFVTAHDKYAIQAFEVNAIDYLLKPVTRERFQQALARVRERVSTQGLDNQHVFVAAAAAGGAAEVSGARRAAIRRQDLLRQHRRRAVRAGRGELRAAAPQGLAAPAARAHRHARSLARSADVPAHSSITGRERAPHPGARDRAPRRIHRGVEGWRAAAVEPQLSREDQALGVRIRSRR